MRADRVSDSRARLSGGRKKFNGNFIVSASVFLYNLDVAGVIYITYLATDYKRLR